MRPSSSKIHGERSQVDISSEWEQRRRVDDMVDAYVAWREACTLVADGYAHWSQAGRQEEKLVFAEYIAALNCEEDAAAAYQQAVERVVAATVTAHA